MEYERKELECKTCGLRFKKVAHLMVHSKTHRNESQHFLSAQEKPNVEENYDEWMESFADRLVALTRESIENDAPTNDNQSSARSRSLPGSRSVSSQQSRHVHRSHDSHRQRPLLRRTYSVPPPPSYPPYEDHRSVDAGRQWSSGQVQGQRRHTFSGELQMQSSAVRSVPSTGSSREFVAELSGAGLQMQSSIIRSVPSTGSSRRLVGELSGHNARIVPKKTFKDAAEAVRLGNSAMFHHLERNDAETAARYYREALKLAPRNASLMGNYALLLQHSLKNYEAAEKMYSEATHLDPTNATLLANYASFLKTVRKDIKQADLLYERAVKADPQHAGNLGNYAAFLHRYKGDMNAAKDLFECALEVDPRHANNLTRYASLLKKGFNDYSNAKRLYEQAMSIEPQNANTLTNLANLLREQAAVADESAREQLLHHAQALYQDAMTANPDNLLVKRNYKALLQDLPLPRPKSVGHLQKSSAAARRVEDHRVDVETKS